jgi:hypothetical protein
LNCEIDGVKSKGIAFFLLFIGFFAEAGKLLTFHLLVGLPDISLFRISNPLVFLFSYFPD